MFSKTAITNKILAYIIRKCTYVYVCLGKFCNNLFSFFAPLGPLGLIIVSQKSVAMLQCSNAMVSAVVWQQMINDPICMGRGSDNMYVSNDCLLEV